MPSRVVPMNVLGWGADTPSAVLSNATLTERFQVDKDWIVAKTGIRERRVATPEDSTASLGIAASQRALACAEVSPDEIDLLVVATTTPEQPMPLTAAFISEALGIRCAAFDLNTACSGFVYALVLAAGYLNLGTPRRALVVGTETTSRIVNPDDRPTAVLFGDGAGALVVGGSASDDAGLLAWDLGCDGALRELVEIPAGGSRLPATGETLTQGENWIRMRGRDVFEFAVRTIVESVGATLEQAGVDLADVSWFVPHQANARIIEAVGEKLGVDPARVILNLDRFGNTSSASIPMALGEAADAGRVKPGDLVLMSSVGAGMTWGTALIRW